MDSEHVLTALPAYWADVLRQALAQHPALDGLWVAGIETQAAGAAPYRVYLLVARTRATGLRERQMSGHALAARLLLCMGALRQPMDVAATGSVLFSTRLPDPHLLRRLRAVPGIEVLPPV